jgi:beta-lactamase superfamily II metal-dependent hydrolase
MDRPRSSLLSHVLGAATAVLLLAVPLTALAAGNGKLQIHHMKIGQGDGTLLISPNGQTALFDDGVYTDCTYIKSFLQGFGLTTVDYHFLSHYHADHLGCIDDLAAVGITIATAGYDRGYSYSSASYTSYVNTLGAKRTTVSKGQIVTLDAASANPVTVRCIDLNGAGVYSVSGSDENSKSAVFKVSYGAFDEVIGGDLTGSVANGNDVETTVGPEVGDVEVYKVHHHGSRYSSNDNWLNAVTAEVGIIMCGDGNTYGHPTLDALTRMHNHNIHTYWTETGAGATPDPSWDKVANGTVKVEVDLAANNYVVTNGTFTDTYALGGAPPPPPLNDTQVATAATATLGTVTGGSAASLAADDASVMTVTAAKSGTKYGTDWYGEATLAHPPLNLTVRYNGSFSVSRTQTLYLWNWGTSAWDQVDVATVSSTDVTRTWTTPTPGNYVSLTGGVRCRVAGNLRNSSYTCRADYMAFQYDYASGTIITMSPETYASLVPADFHEPYRDVTPQARVLSVQAAASPGGVRLEWTTARNEHMDGFNIYRQQPDGTLTLVGQEALVDVTSDDIRYGFTDAAAPAGENLYFLGARACVGEEGRIGPLRVTQSAAVPVSARLALAAGPNPTRGALHFALTLGEAANARLDVFDVTGRRVATPHAGMLAAGAHSLDWDPANADGTRLATGVYFARFEALGRTSLVRLTVLDR